jgi:hypothetical protein
MSAFLLGSFFLFLIQFATPHIWGADGYLHIYLAKLTRQSGFIQSLPQLPFSLFATHFSNKDWLYHLFASPFTFLPNLILAAKIFALLNTLIFLAIFIFIIKKNSSSSKIAYLAILFLFTSFDFLGTLSRPRPMVLSFALMLFSLYLLSQKKIKLFLLTTIFYTAWHTSGPLLSLFFAGIYTFIQLIKIKKINYSLLPLTLVALSLGILIHPNFPNNLYDRYLTTILIPWYTNRWGVLESGAEFFPLPFFQYLIKYPLLIPLNLTTFYLAFQNFRSFKLKNLSFQKLLFFLANAAFFYLSFRSRRYTAQVFPLSILTFFLFLPKKKLSFLTQLSFFLFPLLFLNTLINLKQSLLSTKLYNSHFEKTAKIIKETIPEGEIIFHANWSDSQYLLGLAPNYKYLVTLDPIYMYQYDQDFYKKYRSIAHAQEEKPEEEIQKNFHSTYIHTDKIYFYPFYQQLLENQKVEVLYEDQIGALLKIK